ncbi:cytochrome P450 [Kitasatospora sp. NPDC006697]|uniref:cytochrome P450 n=1 Tax=Kitasatospora sp. NPDC006697 TaxID=3364020 RepID=UPI00367D030B
MTPPDRTPEVPRYPFGEPHLLALDSRYAGLRDREGPSRVEVGGLGEAWLCSRYADVRRLLTEPRFALTPPAGTPDLAAEQAVRIAAAGLKPRRIERLRGATESIADGLLDRLAPPADLMAAFVKPLTTAVLCELIGVPAADRPGVQALLLGAATTADPPSEAERQDRRGLFRYLAGLLAERTGESEDLLGSMVRDRGEADDRQLVRAAMRLLLPGLQNTVLMLANFVCALAHHRPDLASLRRHPELVPTAVEELIRFTPFHSTSTFPRYAAEDIELGGTLLRRGDAVLGALCAANRDERAFAAPDAFDIRRTENAHLGFGMGPHHCPGAALVRLQLQVALGALARRIDGLRLAPAGDRDGRVIRWSDPLPVTWAAINGRTGGPAGSSPDPSDC